MAPPTTSILLSKTTPAPPTGQQDIVFQSDGATPQQSISAYDPVMVGDSGSGGKAGNVPAAGSGDAAAGKFLKADGTFAVPTKGVGVVGITIDGGGSVPGTGLRGRIQIPYGCTVTGWSIIADQSGSCSFDLWFIAGSAPPAAPSIPTSANKISASAPAAVSSAQSASGGASAISTWTTAASQWGSFGFNLASVATMTLITIEIYLAKL